MLNSVYIIFYPPNKTETTEQININTQMKQQNILKTDETTYNQTEWCGNMFE